MSKGKKKSLLASDSKDKKYENKIIVELQVVLEKANVVFNMDHLAFAGDLPVGINYMHLLINRFKKMGTKGNIIGIFHGDAAYLTLNDNAYNAYRHVLTGDPNKSGLRRTSLY